MPGTISRRKRIKTRQPSACLSRASCAVVCIWLTTLQCWSTYLTIILCNIALRSSSVTSTYAPLLVCIQHKTCQCGKEIQVKQVLSRTIERPQVHDPTPASKSAPRLSTCLHCRLNNLHMVCLLYTSDAADDLLCV